MKLTSKADLQSAGYRFFVPGKPQPWQRAGHVGAAGRFYTPTETRAYQQKVRMCAVAAGVKLIVGPVAMTLAITFPDRRTRDDDNVEKSIRDALQGRKKKGVWVQTPIAFEDDRQVRHMVRAVTEPDPVRPGVVVTLEPLAPLPDPRADLEDGRRAIGALPEAERSGARAALDRVRALPPLESGVLACSDVPERHRLVGRDGELFERGGKP